MSASYVPLPDLTIPNGTAVSNIWQAERIFSDADAITLYAPAVLDAHTYVFEVSPDPNATAASTWVTFQNATPADVIPPAAGKARAYTDLPMVGAIRIKDTTGNVAADRTWKAGKNFDALQ